MSKSQVPEKQDPTAGLDLYRHQVRDIPGYAMFLIDLNGILITWNAGVGILLGYSEPEWIGKHASIIFTPEDLAVEVCEMEMRKAREGGYATDIRWHRRKDGTEIFANGFMNVIRDESGQVVGYSKILSDETARKQLQDSLTESNAALEQFAYVASHDMQEPLRTMGIFAQLLAKRYRGKLDADADQFINYIVSGSGRMNSLVNDLLAYAKTATEKERPGSVALDEDFESALTMLGQTIEESGGTVTHDPLPTVAADRGQMVRLFQNLVGNALKYRKADEPPRVHVSAKRRKVDWMISVRDNGIGFEPQYATAIFSPFKRLHSAEEYPGTGVGLAICRRIVEGHGGRIWAESTPGEGTVFHFTLPAEGGEDIEHTDTMAGPLNLDPTA